MCIGEETRKGTNKNGNWEMTTARLVEVGDTPRCGTVLELTLADADKDQIGKLKDTLLVWDITELKPAFKGGGVEAKGQLVREGKKG